MGVFLAVALAFGLPLTSLAAAVPAGDTTGRNLLDTPANRILYPYCSTIGSTSANAAFSGSVNWAASSDSGVGYFQAAVPVNGWIARYFDVSESGIYQVEFIYKGNNSARGAVQNYLYAAADYTQGTFKEENKVGGVLSMTGATPPAGAREASNPSDSNRILQTSTKAAGNYFSYILGPFRMEAGRYYLQTQQTTAGTPVAVAVMLVPYDGPLTPPDVTVNPTSLVLDVTTGITGTITAAMEEGWGSLTFESSNTAVATVTYVGVVATVTPVGQGTATITAKATKDGETATATTSVTVNKSSPVSVDKSTLPLDLTTAVSDTVTATVVNGWSGLTFESDNTAVATVSYNGNIATITAQSIGTATVTATVSRSGESGTTAITVNVTRTPPISVDEDTVFLDLKEGPSTANVSATVVGGYTLSGWVSANPAIAAVSGTGNTAVITAVGTGNTTIAAIAVKDGVAETAIINVSVTKNSRMDITYISGQDKVLSVNPVKRTVTVAGGTTAGELGAAIVAPGTEPSDVSVWDSSGNRKNSGALNVGDTLLVEVGDDSCVFKIIVMGDISSTGVAAKKLDGFEVEMHGSNIGEILNNKITLIDGWARYFTIEESIALGKTNGKAANRDTYTTTGQGGVTGAVAGRHQALRSCNNIVTQLQSDNGSIQTYQIRGADGAAKTSALPVTGDVLVVTAQDGVTVKSYTITVENAALSGKLYVNGPATVGMTDDLLIEYHAGQRTPEAEVAIQLPPGVDATLSNTFVNLIGRGEVRLDRFHLSRGKNYDGVFERQDMHRLLGRFSVNYAYQTLGTVEITGSAATGKTITFKGLDLRPNNGADLLLRIEDVCFDKAMAYNFSADLKTKAGTIRNGEPSRASFGVGSEAAEFNVVNKVTDLARTIYDENNFEDRVDPKTAKNPTELKDLQYKEGERAGDYTGFEMTWTAPVGAASVTVQHATGTISAGGVVTLNDDWADLAAVRSADEFFNVTGLTTEGYHRYRLNIVGGPQAGLSNEIGFYSGKLDATMFGVTAASAASSATANKAAINNAIDWLHSIGGGTLRFPANSTSYKTGTVYLKSNVFLYLDTGSFLESQGGYMDDPESAWWCFRDYGSGTNNSSDPYDNPDNFLSKQDDGHCFFQNAMFYARRENNMKIIGTGRIKATGISNSDGTVFNNGTGSRADDMVALKICQNFEFGGVPNGKNLTFDVENKVYIYHQQTLPSGVTKVSGSNDTYVNPIFQSLPIWVDNNGQNPTTDISNMLRVDDCGHFTTLITGSDHINCHDIYYGYNQRAGRDMLDFMGTGDVHATNIMASGISDDIIKPGSDCSLGFTRPVRGLWVRNIVGDTNCNNFQIGSETADDIQDVFVDNLVVLGSNKCGFSISTNDGGYMRNINLNGGQTGPVILPAGGHFERSRTPIFISISHRGRVIGAENRTVNSQRVITNVTIGRVEDLTMKDVDITEVYSGTAYSSGYYPYNNQSEYTSVVVGYGMPNGTEGVVHSYGDLSDQGFDGNYVGMPDGRLTGYIKNVTFDNVHILTKGKGTAANRSLTCNELNVGQYNSPDMGVRPSYGLYLRHTDNFRFINGSLGAENNDARYAIVFDDALNSVIENVTVDTTTYDQVFQTRNSTVSVNGMYFRNGTTPTGLKDRQIIRVEDTRPATLLPDATNFGGVGVTKEFPKDMETLALIGKDSSVKAQFYNQGLENALSVIVAAYDANGRMLNIAENNGTVINHGLLSVTTPVVPGAAEYRAFAWNPVFVPLTESVSIPAM